MTETQGALVQLKAWLAHNPPTADGRLPPERELAQALGVSRAELRKALATLEQAGEVWRHVGKGTFLGERPPEAVLDLRAVTERTNPAEVMAARLVLEPELAATAALHASRADFDAMRNCLAEARRAQSWRQYELWDNEFHRAVAEGARNLVLLSLFDSLNGIRRAVVWGRLRPGNDRPAADHHSFSDHEAIIAAIAVRDPAEAARAMRLHLARVQDNLMARRDAAE